MTQSCDRIRIWTTSFHGERVVNVVPPGWWPTKYSWSTFQGLIAVNGDSEETTRTAVRDVPARHGTGVASQGGKVAPLQVLLQFCGSELRARNGRQLNLNIQLCDV